MSIDKFDDQCPGCLPCLIDPVTGQRIPDDDLSMRAVMRMWRKTTALEREAFHRVTCLNSRQPIDMAIVQTLVARIENAMHTVH